jgi:hypothetical protein
VTANGKWFVTTDNGYPGWARLVEFDATGTSQIVRFERRDGFDRLARSDDRTRMVVSGNFASNNCAHIYDSLTDIIGPCKMFSDNPRMISGVDYSGNLWVTRKYIYGREFDRLRQVDRPYFTGTGSLSPGDQYLYAWTVNGVDVVRYSDWWIEFRIPTPMLSNGRVLLTPDGQLMVGVSGGRVVAIELN